jgi:hypothetical protein
MIALVMDDDGRRSASSGVFAFWFLQNFFRARHTEIIRSSIRRTAYDSSLSLAREEAALDVERRDARIDSTILFARSCQATEATNMMDSLRCSRIEPFAKRNESV